MKSLMRTEMEKAIYEANLGERDTIVANKYLVEQLPHSDIAEELGYARSTITRYLQEIIPKVEKTAKKLFDKDSEQLH